MMQELYDLPDNQRVCRAFAFAAYQTWGELRDFDELGEESITDYRILQLKRMCPEEVTVIKFNKSKESKAGADWEWWFGCKNEWFGMRVQAKRLDLAKLEYSHLDHIIGKTQSRQVDKLIEDANVHDLYPMYCFYNHWNRASSISWPCGTFAQRTELWGASVADAQDIQYCVNNGQKKLSEITKISMPLMCLACCRGHADDPSNPTLPHRARGIAVRLRGNPNDVPRLVPQLPVYATRQANIHPEDLPSNLANLDGILIVEERPVVYGERDY